MKSLAEVFSLIWWERIIHRLRGRNQVAYTVTQMLRRICRLSTYKTHFAWYSPSTNLARGLAKPSLRNTRWNFSKILTWKSASRVYFQKNNRKPHCGYGRNKYQRFPIELSRNHVQMIRLPHAKEPRKQRQQSLQNKPYISTESIERLVQTICPCKVRRVISGWPEGCY